MKRTLIIAEKPSVARDIAAILEVKKKKTGYLENDKYYISWFIGHLLTLADPHDYNKDLKKWTLEDLPIIPRKFKHKVVEVRGVRDKKADSQLAIIKALMNSPEVNEIICATDPGPEGEYIFREVYYYLKCNKPVKRLWLKSLAESAIKSALDNILPMSSYDNLYYSARCRSEADWLMGINLSRAYSVKLKGKYSIGRVQTPTLALLSTRENEINEFNSQKFYTIKADYGPFAGKYFIPDRKDGNPPEWILDKTETEKLKELIDGKEGIVQSITQKEIKEKPPFLYDLDSLRVDCSSYLGLTAEETLQIVQSLYERKLVSYPRTDSCYLSTKDVPILKSILCALRNIYPEYVDDIIQNNYTIFPEFINDDKVTEHSALIPTEKNAANSFANDIQGKVFLLIAKRFLSAFLPQYEGVSINVLIDYPGYNIEGKFYASGRITKTPGWKKVYDFDDIDFDLSSISEGSKLITQKIEVEEKKTRPPSRYTDGSLIDAMKTAGRLIEDPEARALMKGIGTAATRSGIIERLISIGYVQRVGRILYPTPKGMEIISLIEDDVLKSPELTGEWEKKRYLIEQGKYPPDKFMDEIKNLLISMIKTLKGERPSYESPMGLNTEVRDNFVKDNSELKKPESKIITLTICKNLIKNSKKEKTLCISRKPVLVKNDSTNNSPNKSTNKLISITHGK